MIFWKKIVSCCSSKMSRIMKANLLRIKIKQFHKILNWTKSNLKSQMKRWSKTTLSNICLQTLLIIRKLKILKIIINPLQLTLSINYLVLKRMIKIWISREKIYLEIIFNQMNTIAQILMLDKSKKIKFNKIYYLKQQDKT